MPIATYRAITKDHTLLQAKYQYVSFELESPSRLEFQAGQFAIFSIPNSSIKRSYSIASPPSLSHQIDILVDVGPKGDGSLYLQSLNPGEKVEFMAPAGQFFLQSDPEETELVLIANGSGISAIRSMILDLLQTKHDQRQITLYWGMRQVQDIFWEEEFRLLSSQFPNFHFDLVLSRPPSGWPLCSGHVTDCLTSHRSSFSQVGYYLCGSQGMIQAVSQYLSANGVPPTHIHHESFF